LEADTDRAVSNVERTRVEKIFGVMERTIHNFFHERPFLGKGVTGWVLGQLGRPFRLHRRKIWNRYAYNKDGRMTNHTALRTVLPSLLGLIALIWAVLGII
jgi:hypothetical protein